MEIFAHRGASGDYPENTLAAFYAASQLPIAGIELDVHLTADGELVVIHDETIDRTSNGIGFVKDFTLQQLRTFDYGSWFSEQFAEERIPTIGEVFELFKGTHHRINIEIKSDIFPYPGIEAFLLKEITNHQMTERVLISSFNHEALQKIGQLAPYIDTAALFSEILIDYTTYASHIPVNAIHVSLPAAFRRPVREAVAQQSVVRVYTVNEVEQARELEQQGIQAIFTDYPEKIYKYLQENKE